MIGKLTLLTAALAAASGLVLLEMPAGDKPGALFRPDDASVVAQGQAIYDRDCASCHGADLEGQPDWRNRDADGYLPAPPHDETGHTWHHPDALLFEITKLGVGKASGIDGYKTRMPAYADSLTDEEIIAVLSYIKAQWPDATRRRHDELNAHYAAQSK